MNFHPVQHGTLPVGTLTDRGVITQVSFTAYRIGGEWVPFAAIHGAYAPVSPLVSLGGAL